MSDFQTDPNPNTKAVDIAVSWVRFLLPFAIGAVGLYVGLIIAPMETKIAKLSADMKICTTHVIQDSEIMKQFQRRLTKTEESMENHKLYDHTTFCLKDDFKEMKSELHGLIDQLGRHKERHYYNNSAPSNQGGN